jgi:drug/metabolite transporter (DMT)-like permease
MYFGFGETAALVTAASWAGSCQAHTIVGRRIGSYAMIVARVPIFSGCVALVALVSGTSTSMSPDALLFIGVSAFMGLVAGDQLIYYACVTIGPRLAVLIQSLSACVTAVAGYYCLGEVIGMTGIAGILAATGGVVFVMLEGGVKASSDLAFISPGQKMKGFAAAWASAFALSASFVFLKLGLLTGVSPIWCSFVRTVMGGGMLWGIALGQRRLCGSLRMVWTSRPILKLLVFAGCVSSIGNIAAPVAMQYTETGIAATLIGLQPIAIIPITALIDRTIPSTHAIIGTVIAFIGTAMIFLR